MISWTRFGRIVSNQMKGLNVTTLVKEYGNAKSVIYKWIRLYSKFGNSHCENISFHQLREICKKIAKMREKK